MKYIDNDSLVKDIKKTLIDRNLNVSDVAKRMGILPQTLHGILNKKNLSFADVSKIMNVLECELHYDLKELNRYYQSNNEIAEGR